MARTPSMKSWIAVLVGLFACLLIASPAFAQAPYSEKEAQAIDRMLMCPVCPAETIDQAQVEISFQMRALVREMLAEGRSRQEILDFFVERYGPDILAAPPKSGANLLAWVLPIAGVAAGLVGAYFVIRSMTARNRGRGTPGTVPSPAMIRIWSLTWKWWTGGWRQNASPEQLWPADPRLPQGTKSLMPCKVQLPKRSMAEEVNG